MSSVSRKSYTLQNGNLKEKKYKLQYVICILEVLNALDDPNNITIQETTESNEQVKVTLEHIYNLPTVDLNRDDKPDVDLNRENFFAALNDQTPLNAVCQWLTLMQSGMQSGEESSR